MTFMLLDERANAVGAWENLNDAVKCLRVVSADEPEGFSLIEFGDDGMPIRSIDEEGNTA